MSMSLNASILKKNVPRFATKYFTNIELYNNSQLTIQAQAKFFFNCHMCIVRYYLFELSWLTREMKLCVNHIKKKILTLYLSITKEWESFHLLLGKLQILCSSVPWELGYTNNQYPCLFLFIHVSFHFQK